VQDVIGDWHDWGQLATRRKSCSVEFRASALVSALRNITRAKFRQAVTTLTETRTALAGKKPFRSCRTREPSRPKFHGSICRRLSVRQGVILSGVNA